MPKKSTKLIIVESPTKAKTISRFLGSEYKVESSYGHIRDLPKSKLGVDVEKNFEPTYIIPTRVKKRVSELKKLAGSAEEVILATDEDREGEAIAWHLVQALSLNQMPSKSKAATTRIVFHEITKQAIEEALANPRGIDLNLVNAQQARRIIDRLVGYKLSPFLWKKVMRGLSAGRVQSVTVRLIVEREKEIEKFKPEEFWTIAALLRSKEGEFEAKLVKQDGKTLDKFAIKSKKEADEFLKNLDKAEYVIEKIEKKESKKNPLPPFTTSTLQQAAGSRLGFSSKQTMMFAQKLYEGISLGKKGQTGLITYMRTDSLNLSAQSLEKAKGWLFENLGGKYALDNPRVFKTKSKGAQEAHEAIRPTDPAITPESVEEHLEPRQFKLYKLIWQRFIASQMPPAIFDSTKVDVSAGNFIFRASGLSLKFDGFLKVYPTKTEDVILPPLEEKENLKLKELKPDQHFTEPPPRYSEATLVKKLEELGIGRPSTYAPTISTIQERGYVAKNDQKRLEPTEIGTEVNDLLVEHFANILDYQFTANLEEDFDEVAQGTKQWQLVTGDFYDPFAKNLAKKEVEVEKQKMEEPTDEKCEKCGSPMVIKRGRFGKFMACSGFPECRNTKQIGEEKDEKLEKILKEEKCPQCGSDLVLKRGRFGQFFGCSGYPDCRFIKPILKSTGVNCPKCKEGEIAERKTKRGRPFYGCGRYPKCDFALWSKPTGEKCPKCESLMVFAAKGKTRCSKKECGYED